MTDVERQQISRDRRRIAAPPKPPPDPVKAAKSRIAELMKRIGAKPEAEESHAKP
jgi:hypothetical protein